MPDFRILHISRTGRLSLDVSDKFGNSSSKINLPKPHKNANLTIRKPSTSPNLS
jgi:hypothetical protein